jgi:mono/diheme cytochrome c family protein
VNLCGATKRPARDTFEALREIQFREAAMLRISAKIMALVVWVFPVVSQGSQAPTAAAPAPQTQAAANSPSMASNTMNPVHPTTESRARAKAIYGYDCVMCHGANGDGKGDMNRKNVPDLRDPATLKGLTDGDMYNIIEVGRADMPDMPAEDGRAKPDEIWNLVIYLRSFSKSPDSAAHP